MTLSEKQRLFSRLFTSLLVWIHEQPGYEVVGGDWHRTPADAAANAAQGTGIVHSLHTLSLACDLNLFLHGVYQPDSEAYRPLGEYWKSLHPLCRWGGDFSKPDGDHFSLEHEGIR